MPYKFKVDMLNRLDNKALTEGNTDSPDHLKTGLMTNYQIRKIKASVAKKDRTSSCLIIDAMGKKHHQNIKYIREVITYPQIKDKRGIRDEYNIYLIHDLVAQVASQEIKVAVEACADASGGFIKELNCSECKFTHSRAFSYLVTTKIKDITVILMEMISTKHDYETIKKFFSYSKNIYENEYGIRAFKNLVKLIKIDMSSALMNGACEGLNDVSLIEYLNDIYQGKNLSKYTWLLLCCGHFIHMPKAN